MLKTKIKTLAMVLILLFLGFQITSKFLFYTSEAKAETFNTKLMERREDIAQRQENIKANMRYSAQEENSAEHLTAITLPLTGPVQTPFTLVISIVFGATLLVTWDHVSEHIKNKRTQSSTQ